MTLNRLVSALGAAAMLAVTHSATADTITLIDPNFSVCTLGTVDVSSCGPTDPQLVAGGVSVGVIGNAGNGPLAPFLLLLAVPDLPTPAYPGAPAATPVLGTSATLAVALANQAYYGQTNTPVNGYLGELTTSDLYTFAGLLGGNNSMNFPNMSGFSGELSLHGGVAPTSFSIFEFTVTPTPPGTGNLGTSTVYDIPFASVQAGTYVAAYGIENDPATNGTHVYDSAFTVAGFVTRGTTPDQFVPEPATLLLLGVAGVAFSLGGRRHS